MDQSARKWADRRSAERHDIRLEARARRPGRNYSVVTITDISTDGFAILGLESYSPGADITIYLPGLGPKLATVMWQRDGRTGSRFFEPLHAAVVDHLAQRFG